MNSEKDNYRTEYIESIQTRVEVETGIRPAFRQVDKHVGSVACTVKLGSPPWMKYISSSVKVELN